MSADQGFRTVVKVEDREVVRFRRGSRSLIRAEARASRLKDSRGRRKAELRLRRELERRGLTTSAPAAGRSTRSRRSAAEPTDSDPTATGAPSLVAVRPASVDSGVSPARAGVEGATPSGV